MAMAMRRSKSCTIDLKFQNDDVYERRRNSEAGHSRILQCRSRAQRSQAVTTRIPASTGPVKCKPPSGNQVSRSETPDQTNVMVATPTSNLKSNSSLTLDGATAMGVLPSAASEPHSIGRNTCEDGAISSRSYKLVSSMYDQCYPLSSRPSNDMSIYQIQEQSWCRTFKDNATTHAHTNGSVSAPNKTRLLTSRQRLQATPVTRRLHPSLQRTQSSTSRFSKFSYQSGFRDSSDGMDNTDQSSETDQEKEPKRHKISAHDIDRDTLEKVRWWMKTLPKRFSGLSNVLSVPDPTVDFRD